MGHRLTVILLCLTLGGCATGWGCDGWKKITPTKRDVSVISDRLATQILEHDEFGLRQGCWKK